MVKPFFQLFFFRFCYFKGVPISPSLYAWLAVLVLPVNSALNPILYTLTTAVFKQQLRRYCQALPTCSHMFLERQHTQLGFESAISTSLGQFGSSKSNKSTMGRKRSSQRCSLRCSQRCTNHVWDREKFVHFDDTLL